MSCEKKEVTCRHAIIPLAFLAALLLVGALLVSLIEVRQTLYVLPHHVYFGHTKRLFQSEPTDAWLSWDLPETDIGNRVLPIFPTFSIEYKGEEIPLSRDLATFRGYGFDADPGHLMLQKGTLTLAFDHNRNSTGIFCDDFSLFIDGATDSLMRSIGMYIENGTKEVVLIWRPLSSPESGKKVSLPPSHEDLEKQFGSDLKLDEEYYFFGYQLPLY